MTVASTILREQLVAGIASCYVRLSFGIEHIDHLDQAFAAVSETTRLSPRPPEDAKNQQNKVLPAKSSGWRHQIVPNT